MVSICFIIIKHQLQRQQVNRTLFADELVGATALEVRNATVGYVSALYDNKKQSCFRSFHAPRGRKLSQ